LLFSTLWTTTFYGFEVMPNEWVAFGVVAACGYLLRYLDPDDPGRRRFLVGVALAMAAVALLRPSDAAYSAVPLLIGCLVIRGAGRRRAIAAASVALGAVAGSLEWVYEAYARFGGLGRR